MTRAWLIPVVIGLSGCGGHAAPLVPPTASNTSASCGDLLAEANRKPEGLVLIGCIATDGQGRPLRATYRVTGARAAAVEAVLAQVASLPPLRRNCCRWDGPAGGFIDATGRSYTVRMVSDETSVTDRRAWGRIHAFIVTVDRLTEEI